MTSFKSFQSDRPVWYSPAKLREAFWRVRSNRGIAGADGVPIEVFAGRLDAEIDLLTNELAAGRYFSAARQTVAVEQPGKRARILKIPSVRDRVVETALATHLGEQAEPLFSQASHGYRPRRSVATALHAVECNLAREARWVLDADITAFFDSIPHRKLLDALARWPGGNVVVDRVCEVLAQSAATFGHGIGQGSPLSPLLSNIYLDQLDRALEKSGAAHVRYADDFVGFAAGEIEARRLHALAGTTLAAMGLGLHEQKTRVVPVDEGFRFLGATIAVSDSAGNTRPRVQFPGWLAGTGQRAASADADPDSTESGTSPRVTAEQASESPASSGTLRTLYVLQAGACLKRDGDRLVAFKEGRELGAFPIHRVDLVMAFGSTVVTTPAMRLALEYDIPIVLMAANGEFQGIVDSHDTRRVQVQARQFACASDPAAGLELARAFVIAKIGNGLTMLKRYGDRRCCPGLAPHLAAMRQLREQVRRVGALEHMRGCEGLAARSLFAAMRELLGETWAFRERNRRPPRDPVNAMLSFGYALLHHNVFALLKAQGLNPHLGHLHAPRPGHAALASDMMEVFRAPVVEALVLNLALNGRMRPGDFTAGAEGASLMNDEARRRFVAAFEEKMGGDAGYRHSIATQVQAYTAHLRDPTATPFRPFQIR